MSKLRLRISMSLDGFVAGPHQSLENPLGVGGMRLHEWVFPLAAWRSMQGQKGGIDNESSKVVVESLANLGATIMGRNMFGGGPGPWNRAKPWNGWWGVDPPYHHPVFVLTHHPREPLPLEGGNHFQLRHRWHRVGTRSGSARGERKGCVTRWRSERRPAISHRRISR